MPDTRTTIDITSLGRNSEDVSSDAVLTKGSGGYAEWAEPGGGGGSLPAWWMVNSTPGSESVEFAGYVRVAPDNDDDDPFIVRNGSGDVMLAVQLPGAGQATFITARDAGDVGLAIQNGAVSPTADLVQAGDFAEFRIGPTGAVTVIPSVDDVNALTIVQQTHDFSDEARGALSVRDTDANELARLRWYEAGADRVGQLHVARQAGGVTQQFADVYPTGLVIDDGATIFVSLAATVGEGAYLELWGIEPGRSPFEIYETYSSSESLFEVSDTGALRISPTGGAAPLTLTGLPAADPSVPGQLYHTAGAVMVSL